MAATTERASNVAVLCGDSNAELSAIVGALPAGLDLAVVVTGGLEPIPTAALPIIPVDGHTPLLADRVYVVPAGRTATFDGTALALAEGGSRRGGLDQLLRAVADELGRGAAGVVVAGHGSDGALGIKRLKELGGLTIARPPSDGDDHELPRAAIATGLVDLVQPPEQIAASLTAFAKTRGDLVEDERQAAAEAATSTLRDILTLVRIRTGHDFSSYKRATLYRRVARRMQVCQTPTFVDYHRFLREHPNELTNLVRDFLISVTNFFRDPDSFDALAQQILPKIFAGKSPGDTVRVWVAGCATGEEAYSIAILLHEYALALEAPPLLQVFATDIDEASLAAARTGRYPEAIALDISPGRLARFFTLENNEYRVNKDVRETVLFSPHSLLRDPPFSRLDLVSCRNLLIYLNRDGQEHVLGMFHFGLRPDGYLFLGSSESAEGSALFSALDAKHRIFVRRLSATSVDVDTIVSTGRWQPKLASPAPMSSVERQPTFGELHHRMVERYAPPSVMVNDELDIVHLSEHAGDFLVVAGGEPSRQLLRLVHPALRLELRTSIYAARQSTRGADARVVQFVDRGIARAVELRVRTIDVPELGPNALLVMFDEQAPSTRAGGTPPISSETYIEPVVRELENELQRTRDQLRTTIEQYETSLEELKASNEELQAINEELRSASEELETGKEELQSVNEELTTVNHELKSKMDEVSHANSDLQNLMMSTDIGVVFLDRQFNIKRFTPRVQDLFNLIPSDVGRPLAHVTHQLETSELPELARGVLQTLRVVERELRARDGRRYLTRVLPYRSIDDRIDGVVLTFVDTTDLFDAREGQRKSEAALVASEERLRFALRSAPITVLCVDRTAAITWAYVHGTELAHPAAARTMFVGDSAARFDATVIDALAHRTSQHVELAVTVGGNDRIYDFWIEGTAEIVYAVGFDISPMKHAEQSLRDADRRKDEFLAMLSHELRNPLTPLKVALDVAKLTDDPAQAVAARGVIERQVAQLQRLVDDLLDLSRVTQGKITLEKQLLDPRAVIDAALETVAPAMTAHRHKLKVTLPPERAQLFGDHARLSQLFTNVLGNAAKYTPDGGAIALTMTIDEVRRRLAVEVTDNGIGIAPNVLPHIFEIFVQGRDDHGRTRGGLGIGLNLARRLVEMHGGTVAAVSDGPGRGTRVTIELPLATDRAPA